MNGWPLPGPRWGSWQRSHTPRKRRLSATLIRNIFVGRLWHHTSSDRSTSSVQPTRSMWMSRCAAWVVLFLNVCGQCFNHLLGWTVANYSTGVWSFFGYWNFSCTGHGISQSLLEAGSWLHHCSNLSFWRSMDGSIHHYSRKGFGWLAWRTCYHNCIQAEKQEHDRRKHDVWYETSSS